VTPLPDDVQRIIDQMLPREAIARTAWGESDCLGTLGIWATINTGQNRLNSGIRWWGHDLKSIFLHAGKTGIHQYSCWNADNPRLQKILALTEENPIYREALDLADFALAGNLADITCHASHYYNHEIIKTPPSWARGRTTCWILEPHWFYEVYD
jgi:N-acetylmuramoyl-L-alanine amidase